MLKISLYSGLNDLRRKSIKALTELRQAGLTMAYTGLESGDRVTLERINKGLTPEQAEAGMAKAKAAGIEILISIIFGIGGKDRSREHIVETIRLLNLMEPEQIALENKNSTSFVLRVRHHSFHPSAHISIGAGGSASLTNPQPAPYCGIIYFPDLIFYVKNTFV